jgi:hypothetical protein
MSVQPPPVGPPKANAKDKELTPFKVFGMYVDGAKWLLAIIAGLLVVGMEWLKDRSGSGADVSLFLAAAVLLLISGGLALLYLWQSYTYVSLHVGGRDPDGADGARSIASAVYPFMLGAFAFGAILFAVFGWANLMARIENRKPLAIVGVDQGLIVAQRGTCLWVRNATAGPQVGWTRIPTTGPGQKPTC